MVFIILADQKRPARNKDSQSIIMSSGALAQRVESLLTPRGPKIEQKLLKAMSTFIKYDR